MRKYSLPSLPTLLAAVLASAGLLVFSVPYAHSQDIEFNTDVLDVKDRANIDLSRFSQKGFILPGIYELMLNINGQNISTSAIKIIDKEDEQAGSTVCLENGLVQKLGLKENLLDQLKWWNDGQCLSVASLDGMEVRADIGKSTVYVNIPQAYLEYTNAYWDPPSRWDDGISGVILDYYLNARTFDQKGRYSRRGDDLTGNGVLGANLGAWRFRAGWQARTNNNGGQYGQNKFQWTDYYFYRAIKEYRAKLLVGESYLNSDIFDSFRYTGISLTSEDNMLPPNLRGYSPEVTGVARSNAKVTISQQGRIIKEILVPAGPFRIQDLDSTVSGNLDVQVQEADGSIQDFQVTTATIPYLTRPGQVRFKLLAGQPSDWEHNLYGPKFIGGEFSWGVSNRWSLYGGTLISDKYQALTSGVGRDLSVLGALSFDVTHARNSLTNAVERQSGNSYRLSYSKKFDVTNSQIAFAGYRFSDKGFLSMADYVNAQNNLSGIAALTGLKQMYTFSFNQQLGKVSGYLNYNRQVYWNNTRTQRYNMALSSYLDIGKFRNVSVSLNAYTSRFNGAKDKGIFLSLSIPWGKSGRMTYNSSHTSPSSNSHSLGYADHLANGDYYSVRASSYDGKADMNGFYSHDTSIAKIDATASYRAGDYSSFQVSARGGVTMTPEGSALHPSSFNGGTRVLVDTKGVAGIPVGSYSTGTVTNGEGKAVVSNVASYSRSAVKIDVNKLSDNAQVANSILSGTLTDGAISYRRFDVIEGYKAMAVISLEDGTYPPFGAILLNEQKQELGIFNDGGMIYMLGIKKGETVKAQWSGKDQCQIVIPEDLPENFGMDLEMTCKK